MSLESEDVYLGHPGGEESDVSILPYELEREAVIASANYLGNWTELLKARVQNPITKERFLASKTDFPTTEIRTVDELELAQKPQDIPRDHFNQTIVGYDQNIDKVFGSTGYETTESYLENGGAFHQPSSLGASKEYGDPGTVFRDAKYNDRPLRSREKTIIEAHEKAHGLFMNLTKDEKRNILSAFDLQRLSHKHDAKADEVLARMSQVKNYFGFKGDEIFTKAHLDYARKHYVNDIGLDNSISDMFNAIDDEDKFIYLMNTIAC